VLTGRTLVIDNIVPITINDISITEGSAGNITITLGNAVPGNVTVNYTLTAGTATSGVDYTYIAGTATITSGTTSTTVNLTTLQDTIYEGNEMFNVILSSPSANAKITDAT